MTADPERLGNIPLSGVQMLDAYVHEVHLERRDRVDGDPPGLALEVGIAGQTQPGGESSVFAVILQAHVVAPFNEDRATADLRCSVTGVFRIDDPSAVDQGRFSSREAVVLIYPYLRASVGQVWRMSGITVPPMPTLDTVALLAAIDAMPGIEPSPPSASVTPRKRRRKAERSEG